MYHLRVEDRFSNVPFLFQLGISVSSSNKEIYLKKWIKFIFFPTMDKILSPKYIKQFYSCSLLGHKELKCNLQEIKNNKGRIHKT